jgi:hypothetical protein
MVTVVTTWVLAPRGPLKRLQQLARGKSEVGYLSTNLQSSLQEIPSQPIIEIDLLATCFSMSCKLVLTLQAQVVNH